MKVVMKKHKRNCLLVILLLLFLCFESGAAENLSAQDEEGTVNASDNSEKTAEVQGVKSDEIERPCVSSDDKNENTKLEQADRVSTSNEEQPQISKSEDIKGSQQVADSKQANDNSNECNQQSGSEAAKNEELKVEESDKPPVALDDSKQQKCKEDDKIQKTNLNDVNSQVEDSDHAKSVKRETYSESGSFAWGLPRDASYFFDDLEPFINSSSDVGRIGRAAPPRDKYQKSHLSGKGKEVIEEDVDEDEEDKNDLDEKQDEDDYDDDEDVDSDCKPTPECPTTAPKCTTTPHCPTTCTTPCPTTCPTTCPPPTTKCTTKHQCPTTCKTTTQCPTTPKCPRICGKGADHKLVKDMDKESDISWEGNKKKHRHGKRRFHNTD